MEEQEPKQKDNRPYRTKYPGFSEEAYQDMEKWRSGPIPKARHAKALKLYADGKGRHDVLKEIKTSSGALSISLKHDAEFAAKWNEARKARRKQIDEKLIELCLQGQTEIRIREVPQRNKDGSIVYFNGKPRWEVQSKDTLIRPPSSDFIKIFLTYFGSTREENSGTLPFEALKDQIIKFNNVREA